MSENSMGDKSGRSGTATPEAAPQVAMTADPGDLASQLGLDVERKWATAVQVFKNPDHALFVFKEVVQFQGIDPQSPELTLSAAVQRNVTSVVLPLNVAVEFSKILSGLMADEIDKG